MSCRWDIARHFTTLCMLHLLWHTVNNLTLRQEYRWLYDTTYHYFAVTILTATSVSYRWQTGGQDRQRASEDGLHHIPGGDPLPAHSTQWQWLSVTRCQVKAPKLCSIPNIINTDSMLDVLVDEFIFWHMRWIQWAGDHQLTLHCTTEHDFDDVNEILFWVETANKLCVIRRSVHIFSH